MPKIVNTYNNIQSSEIVNNNKTSRFNKETQNLFNCFG